MSDSKWLLVETAEVEIDKNDTEIIKKKCDNSSVCVTLYKKYISSYKRKAIENDIKEIKLWVLNTSLFKYKNEICSIFFTTSFFITIVIFT